MKLFIFTLLGIMFHLGVQHGQAQSTTELETVLNTAFSYSGLKPYWRKNTQNQPEIVQIIANNQIPRTTSIQILESAIPVKSGTKGKENSPYLLIIKKIKLGRAKAWVKFDYNKSVSAKITLKRKGNLWMVSKAFIKETTRNTEGKKQKRFTWDF